MARGMGRRHGVRGGFREKRSRASRSCSKRFLLVADLRNSRPIPTRPRRARCSKSRVDKGRGPVATILIQNGTLKSGDFFICGSVFGKVPRDVVTIADGSSMMRRRPRPSKCSDCRECRMRETSSRFTDEAKARHIVEYRQGKQRRRSGWRANQRLAHHARPAPRATEGRRRQGIGNCDKGDVQGSVEVLSEMLPKLSNRAGEAEDHRCRASARSLKMTCCGPPRPGAIVIAFGVAAGPQGAGPGAARACGHPHATRSSTKCPTS